MKRDDTKTKTTTKLSLNKETLRSVSGGWHTLPTPVSPTDGCTTADCKPTSV